MKILLIGDIFSMAGREMIDKHLENMKLPLNMDKTDISLLQMVRTLPMVMVLRIIIINFY